MIIINHVEATGYCPTKCKSYEIAFSLGRETLTFVVEAANPTDARVIAERLLWRRIKTVVKPQ